MAPREKQRDASRYILRLPWSVQSRDDGEKHVEIEVDFDESSLDEAEPQLKEPDTPFPPPFIQLSIYALLVIAFLAVVALSLIWVGEDGVVHVVDRAFNIIQGLLLLGAGFYFGKRVR